MLNGARVNCWFCNSDIAVRPDEVDCFTCTICGQYNGFSANGDYNCEIPAMYDETFNHAPVARGLGAGDITTQHPLCVKCRHEQKLLVSKLAAFEPRSEDTFEEELRAYKHDLERTYRLCNSCQSAVSTTLQEIHRQLKLQWVANRLAVSKSERVTKPARELLLPESIPIGSRLLWLMHSFAAFLVMCSFTIVAFAPDYAILLRVVPYCSRVTFFSVWPKPYVVFGLMMFCILRIRHATRRLCYVVLWLGCMLGLDKSGYQQPLAHALWFAILFVLLLRTRPQSRRLPAAAAAIPFDRPVAPAFTPMSHVDGFPGVLPANSTFMSLNDDGPPYVTPRSTGSAATSLATSAIPAFPKFVASSPSATTVSPTKISSTISPAKIELAPSQWQLQQQQLLSQPSFSFRSDMLRPTAPAKLASAPVEPLRLDEQLTVRKPHQHLARSPPKVTNPFSSAPLDTCMTDVATDVLAPATFLSEGDSAGVEHLFASVRISSDHNLLQRVVVDTVVGLMSLNPRSLLVLAVMLRLTGGTLLGVFAGAIAVLALYGTRQAVAALWAARARVVLRQVAPVAPLWGCGVVIIVRSLREALDSLALSQYLMALVTSIFEGRLWEIVVLVAVLGTLLYGSAADGKVGTAQTVRRPRAEFVRTNM